MELEQTGGLPGFSSLTSRLREDRTWRVLPVPERLQNRHVDIGDLAPSDTERFIQALRSKAQGIQVNGKEVLGPLFDFGLLMYHNGKLLVENKSGPFFYLSKVESYLEARLWNNIFIWTEQKLFQKHTLGPNQLHILREDVVVTPEDLLAMPSLFQKHTLGPNQLHILREDVVVTPEDLLAMPSVAVSAYIMPWRSKAVCCRQLLTNYPKSSQLRPVARCQVVDSTQLAHVTASDWQ
ncbi:Malate synthase, glyoxysomal [Acipenser ruthenus]|uniref:malate synthase n=1 Tax=Acipenser ruthenus TaxID=7906 RepID=A0A444UAL6_ACIRT|nr:Malate synthase, glyoxysomal [Acipenser ruthenus]